MLLRFSVLLQLIYTITTLLYIYCRFKFNNCHIEHTLMPNSRHNFISSLSLSLQPLSTIIIIRPSITSLVGPSCTDTKQRKVSHLFFFHLFFLNHYYGFVFITFLSYVKILILVEHPPHSTRSFIILSPFDSH